MMTTGSRKLPEQTGGPTKSFNGESRVDLDQSNYFLTEMSFLKDFNMRVSLNVLNRKVGLLFKEFVIRMKQFIMWTVREYLKRI